VVEKNPSYYDAYMGLGVFNYMSSMIPRKLQWITGILGFSGDKETGRKQLEMASEKGTYTNTEAKFYLTLLSWREENYPVAEGYANQLKDSHPNSPAIWMLWGLLLSQQDKMADAIQAYEKALVLNKDKQSDIVYKTVYGAISNSYFRTNQFDKAADFGKKYMAYANKDDNVNNRLYSIGVSLELLGNRTEALNYYNQARTDFKEDNEWEKYWLRRLKDRAAKPLTQVDSIFIVADNNRSGGKYDESIAGFQSALLLSSYPQDMVDDVGAQVNQGIGQVYFKQKNFDKAVEQFKKNLNLNPQHEKWLVPEAYFQLGRCMLRMGKKKEADDYFDKALSIDYDYDFKDSMDGKIKNELSKY
jgi:tetratricopeptide (TPR) repeat protein